MRAGKWKGAWTVWQMRERPGRVQWNEKRSTGAEVREVEGANL